MNNTVIYSSFTEVAVLNLNQLMSQELQYFFSLGGNTLNLLKTENVPDSTASRVISIITEASICPYIFRYGDHGIIVGYFKLLMLVLVPVLSLT